uniref:E3 ubiquitin-protein ligase RMA n=1 Tax=Kalanchoe fedtschenkoi TaxID=63787 RepID=A0A7N0VNP4_KALFE
MLPHQIFQQARLKQQQASSAAQFDCNICLSQAKDPVVTCCGHLYCWPCLYPWVKRTSSCAVCRSMLRPDRVFPIYGANADDQLGDEGSSSVSNSRAPRRPPGRRYSSLSDRED